MGWTVLFCVLRSAICLLRSFLFVGLFFLMMRVLLPLETRGQWNRMPQVPANIDRVLKLNASNEDKVGLARQ
jgi:hypothetical protein